MRIKMQAANNNLYTTSSRGMLRIDNLSSQYRLAGMLKPIEPEISLIPVPITSPGIDMLANEYFAYRVFNTYIDSSGNYYISEPSNIVKIKAPASARYQVSIKVNPMFGLTVGHSYAVYRTKKSAAGVDPGDEMYLAYTKKWTSSELSSFATVIDIANDVLLGEQAYTNATSEGIQNANAKPPLSVSIAWFRNHMFFFNTNREQRLFFRLIGTSFTAGERIQIGPYVLTCAITTETDITKVVSGVSPSGENAITGTFVYYAAAPTLSEKIEGTARSIQRVINALPTNNLFYCYYTSLPGGVPGIIEVVSRTLEAPVFSIKSLDDNIRYNFDPVLPFFTTDTPIISDNNKISNGGHISKFNQPEHVPISNTDFYLGDEDNPVLVAHVIKDAIIIIKRRGCWICTGNSLDDFTFREMNTTISFAGVSQCSYPTDNRVYAYSSSGFVAITETGVEPVSVQEDKNILAPPLNVNFNDNDDNGFIACGYELRGLFLASIMDPELYNEAYSGEVPVLPGDRNLFSTYAYNYLEGTWSRFMINANCFAVNQNSLYYGLNVPVDPLSPNKRIMRNRTNGESVASPYFFPFFDEAGTLTVSAVDSSTNTITVSSSSIVTDCPGISSYLMRYRHYKRIVNQQGSQPHRGYMFIKSSPASNIRYLVLSNNGGGLNLSFTMNTVSGLSPGDSLNIFRPIFVYFGKGPFFGSNPQDMKNIIYSSIIGDISNCYELIAEYYDRNDYKSYPEMYAYYPYSPSVNDVFCSVTYPVMDPKDRNLYQIDDLNNQKFYEQFIRPSVDKRRLNTTALHIGICNYFAGSYFNIKSIGIDINQEQTNRTWIA